jgi:hypothetical protein
MPEAMYPDDRVLIGVLNRKRDFVLARDEHWYRIPRDRAPRIIETEYIAFYFSGSFKDQNAGIHYFARRTGHELVRRRDLLPDESQHKNADQLYYKIQIGDLQEKLPPITNPTRRPITFIYTTWDRFVAADKIADLYSNAEWFVERVANVLREIGITPERHWEFEDQHMSELRIRCERGIVSAIAGQSERRTSAPTDGEHTIVLSVGDDDAAVKESIAAIQAAIAGLGGPKFVDIPPEG